MYYNIIFNNKNLNKLLTFIVLVSCTIQMFPKLFIGISSVFGLSDELLILVFFALILFDISKMRLHKMAILLLIFIFIFFILSFFSKYFRGPIIVFAQSLFHLKFFIIFYVLKNVLTNNYIKSFLIIIILITIVGIFANIFFPNYFTEEIYESRAPRFFSFLPRFQGFQGQANILGYFLIIFLTMGSFFIIKLEHKLKFLLYGVFLILIILMVLLSGSRSPLIFLPLVLFYNLKGNVKLNYKTLILITFAGIGMIGLFAFTSDVLIDKTIGNISSIGPRETSELYNPRSFLYYYGFLLFVNFFPFGTGIGTYASTLSADSKVYSYLHIDKIKFVIEEQGLFDSNVACIMGELGFVGVIMFIYLIYKYFKWGLSKYSDSNDIKRYKILFFFFIFLAFKGNVFMNGGVSILFSLFLMYPSSNKILKKNK
jgi:hypothetical protein